MKEDYVLSSEYLKKITELLSEHKSENIFYAMTLVIDDFFLETTIEYIQNYCKNILVQLRETEDIVDSIQRVVLDKAMKDYNSIQHVEAIDEFLKTEAHPTYEDMALKVYEPWLYIDTDQDLNDEERQKIVFQQILTITKPAKTIEFLGLKNGVEVGQKEFEHVLFNALSSVAYHRIIKVIYHQLLNPEVFRLAISQKSHFAVFAKETLSKITFSISQKAF